MSRLVSLLVVQINLRCLFSHNGLKTITGIYRYTARVNKYTLSYRFLNSNVHGCVFAKVRPVSLNRSDYNHYKVER